VIERHELCYRTPVRPEVQREVMQRLLATLSSPDCELTPRTTLVDTERYLDPSQLAAEQATMFRRSIAIIHASELDEVGAFVTVELAGTPLLVTRTEQGIAVHVNACRHRGARLRCEAHGRAKAFTCPYHAWTYRLDGELLHVPSQEVFGELDRASLGLHRVRHEVRHGFVWVSLDGELDVASFLGHTLDDDFAAFALETHRVARRSERTIPANWKLVMDAFAEGYHLKSLHRETLSRFFLESAVLDDCTPHVRQVGARRSLVDVAKDPEAQWDLRRDTTVFYNLFPSSILVFHPSWVSWLSLHPEAVDRVRVIHRALVPAQLDAESQARFDKSFDHIDSGVFEREDLAIAQSIQSTLACRANPFVILGAREEGMRLFHAARDAALAAG